MKNKKRKAFTLIELLVVIAIIGLLASIVLIALSGARVKARDAKRVADLSQIQTALELYYSDTNTGYPPVDCESTSGRYSACWTTFLPAQYIATMPVDPLNVASSYGYYYADGVKPSSSCAYSGTGSDNNYILATQLEDPSAIKNSCGGFFGGWDNFNLNYVVGN